VVGYAPDPLSGPRPYGMLGPAPDAPTYLMVPYGTQLAVTGRRGDQLRVALPGAQPQFIDRRELIAEPRASAVPLAHIISTMRSEDAHRTVLSIELGGVRPPFRVLEGDGGRGAIRIYGAGSRSRYADVPFSLHQHAFWGYHAAWSGSRLVVAFRKPPLFAPPGHPALSGLTVVVDPGHAPDTGAIGPLGTIERDVNLDIGSRLGARLRSLGARVVMTRTSNTAVRLYDRPALAQRIGADVLISVHDNAPPDGIDPRQARGFNVYYFQPHSLALAQSIHAAYVRDVDLPDGGLHSGDYALVRTSEMPAVLTESAYMTWPWEEMRLRDAAFRDELAATMAEGLERWAERMRTLERAP